MPETCVVNCDGVQTIRKATLISRVTKLGPGKMQAVEEAVKFALDLD